MKISPTGSVSLENQSNTEFVLREVLVTEQAIKQMGTINKPGTEGHQGKKPQVPSNGQNWEDKYCRTLLPG